MALTLKAARVNKSLTQDEAAKLLKISPDTLSNYERGRSFPDVPVIKRMEELYELIFYRAFCLLTMIACKKHYRVQMQRKQNLHLQVFLLFVL